MQIFSMHLFILSKSFAYRISLHIHKIYFYDAIIANDDISKFRSGRSKTVLLEPAQRTDNALQLTTALRSLLGQVFSASF